MGSPAAPNLLWPIVAIVIGTALAALAGLIWSAFGALNLHQLHVRVQARERTARKINRLLRDRAQLEFLLQAMMVGGIALGAAATPQLQSIASVRGIVLFGATAVLLVAAVQLGIRAGRAQPERVSALAIHALLPVQRMLRPLLRLMLPAQPPQPAAVEGPGLNTSRATDDVRALLLERTDLAPGQARMLRGVLDLGQIRVGEVMVPRSEIAGIDLDGDLESIASALRNTRHTRLPVFKGEINSVVGVLHARDVHAFLDSETPTRAELLAHTVEPYFVPQGTRLDILLRNLQRDHRRMAFVVDEYGDVQGLVTVDDVLEQIVGDYTTDFTDAQHSIAEDEHGGYVMDASLLLREINQELGWQLPSHGPRTLNGLILEHLEFIPDANVGLQVDGYRIEILSVRDNAVRRARVTRAPEADQQEDL